MIVTVHQPEHMPWLGYFSKMDSADLYVILDDCQYRKDYFQNRNKILTSKGLDYITVPVVKKHIEKTLIKDVLIADNNWKTNYIGRIDASYRKAPYFSSIMPTVERLIRTNHTHISALNISIINTFRDILGITTPIVMSSDYNITSTASKRNADLVRAAGGSIYLSGPSGRDYLVDGDFTDIDIIYHDYVHPIYRQYYEPFIPYASILDLVMNYSPEESINIIRSGYTRRTNKENKQ